MIDYYELLEVNQKASPEIIGEVYKILQKRFEFDSNLKNQDKVQKLQALKDAFDVLSDPVKRKAYDTEFNKAQREAYEFSQKNNRVDTQTAKKPLKLKQNNFSQTLSSDNDTAEMSSSSSLLSRIKWNRWGWAVSILVVVIVLISMVRPDPEKALRGKLAVSLEAEKDRKELDAELHKNDAEKQPVNFTETKGKTELEAKSDDLK
ncbi:MAG: DnaJ domain-containing protein [Methylococcaceae bacterium]|nr:DnaJ domain-containing protein [Methylococcaceae bacterium]